MSKHDPLYRRARELEAEVRDLVTEYYDYTLVLEEYGAYLTTKATTLSRLADELGGARPEPEEHTRNFYDDEIPF